MKTASDKKVICAKTGKERHTDKTQALVSASRIVKPPKRNSGDDRPYRLRAYRCPDCDGFHLTKRFR